jgi:hypothetical protein
MNVAELVALLLSPPENQDRVSRRVYAFGQEVKLRQELGFHFGPESNNDVGSAAFQIRRNRDARTGGHEERGSNCSFPLGSLWMKGSQYECGESQECDHRER